MGIETEYPGSNGRSIKRMTHMIRKTLLGLSAAAALGVAALAPTSASASGISIGFGFGHGFGHGYHGYHGHHGYAPVYYGPKYYAPSCYLQKVKVWSNKHNKFVWRTQRICD